MYYLGMCMSVLPARMCAHQVHALGEYKVSDLLELELWMILSHHVGAGNPT